VILVLFVLMTIYDSAVLHQPLAEFTLELGLIAFGAGAASQVVVKFLYIVCQCLCFGINILWPLK
jgi:hypothetical protein